MNRFVVLAVVGLGGIGVVGWWSVSERSTQTSLTPLAAAADGTSKQSIPEQLEEIGDEPAGTDSPAPTTPQLDVSELRRQFPFESLEARLRYEQRKRQNSRTAPGLSATTRSALEEIERMSADKNMNVRAESLRLLHTDQVSKFTRRPGFGLSRIRDLEPSLDYLEYPEPEPVPLASAAMHSAEQASEPAIVLPQSGIATGPGTSWTPSAEMLSHFHMRDSQHFAGPWSIGYVRARHQVAGFRSHGMAGVSELRRPLQPEEAANPPADHWQVSRLELVSLLKFDEPAVYVSENLPRMNELKEAGTRRLDAFEAQGLEKLQAGEEIVTTATLNEIRMLGAVRAAKQCMQCHDVARGELLGAFSYRMRRDPAISPDSVRAPSRT